MPISKEKKTLYFARMMEILNKYTKAFMVCVDNVGSNAMNKTRLQMRGKAEILMGKNTMMRKILSDFLVKNPNHHFAGLNSRMRGNVGFVFTNEDLGDIKKMLLANRIPAPAKIGAIAPVDVAVPAGPTGCDPGQTAFFQVLQVPTKIVKGQIEITNVVHLIKAGDKVGSSEATLLTKLNIRPFSYGLVILEVCDNGSFFGPKVLEIDAAYLAAQFAIVVNKVAALSFAANYPTQASVAHSVANAFKTLVAIKVGLGGSYTFKEAKAVGF
jgi:large subunit ribosomal protein LP0